MDGFDAYQLFVALRNHFTPGSSYDYIKYGGKTNCTYASYNKRKDKFLFDKLARLPNPRLRTVCAMVEGIDWINDVNGDKGREAQLKHQKYMDTAAYSFKQELPSLPSPLAVLVSCENGVPPLAQLYFQKKVSLETLVIVNNLVDFVSIWNKKIPNDPLVQSLIHKIVKFSPFFGYEKPKIQQIFVDFLHK